MNTAICVFILACLAGTSVAVNDVQPETSRTERQSGWYGPVSNNWPFYYDYPNQEMGYQLRSLLRRPGHGFDPNAIHTDDGAESRLGFGLLNGNLFANRPASILNNLPVIRNPNFPSLIASSFDSCTATSGEMGICTPGFACATYGGRPSGSCNFGTVCCVNVVNTCTSQVTLNNTYWETPSSGVTRPNGCALTIKLDQRLLEQKRPICQIRLDFVSFTTEQPVVGTCSKDAFQVSGASSTAPEICGDNGGQHMYLEVPNSGTTSSNVLLSFTFDRDGTVTPIWKIKIALLPCGADFLAPSNCLQYYSSSTGTIKSFNFKSEAAIRQLNNQDYNICFRTEKIDGKKSSKLCITSCEDANKRSFILSLDGTAPAVAATKGLSQKIEESFCEGDFLLFPGGTDGTNTLDRYCGTVLNPGSEAETWVTVCSTRQPYMIGYTTDGVVPTEDKFNTGFCLTFQQSV